MFSVNLRAFGLKTTCLLDPFLCRMGCGASAVTDEAMAEAELHRTPRGVNQEKVEPMESLEARNLFET